MKNTVYALAGEHLTGAIENFGLVLGRHFLAEPQVGRGRGLDRGACLAPDRIVARRVHPRCGSTRTASWRRRGTASPSSGDRRPHGHEDDPVGVRGVSPRPVHDAEGDRGPDHGHEGHGARGGTRGRRSSTTRPSRRSGRRSSRSSRSTTRVSVQASIWIIARRSSSVIRRSPRSRCRCRTSTTGRWTSARSGSPTTARSTSRRPSRTG